MLFILAINRLLLFIYTYQFNGIMADQQEIGSIFLTIRYLIRCIE
ncbi:hypothetical protein [Vibrio gallaecicus]|nr:hypothetical protein [Vibrio gallaecicus]MDN3616495.1 hypothetical protein [Vibrio gallaecicus]